MLSTRDKILQAAETLLSEQGIASTSLRDITSHAVVNLAAVNYHFGNKQLLVFEVFQRRLDALNNDRLERLDIVLEDSENISLEAVLRALIYPALMLSRDTEKGGSAFVKLIARLYAENNQELHSFLASHYGHVMKRFAKTIQTILPDMPSHELRWQLDFVIGALTYVMADFSGHFSKFGKPKLDAVSEADRLVLFAANGMRSFQPAMAQKDLFVATDVSPSKLNPFNSSSLNIQE